MKYKLKHNPLIIVVAGMYRSGSTWQYNAIRLLMEEAGHTVFGGGFEECQHELGRYNFSHPFEKQEELAEVFIVKEHRWIISLANSAHLVFTSDRNKDEVISSYERVTNDYNIDKAEQKVSPEQYAKWCMQLAQWRRVSAYHMPYAEIVRDDASRLGVICDLAAEIATAYESEIPFSANEYDLNGVMDKLANLKPPTDVRQDPVTLMYWNHRA